MKLKPFLYMLIIFAFFLSACGADTGVDDPAVDNANGVGDTTGVGNTNDFGANDNGFDANTNGNINGGNANDNFNGGTTNTNANANGPVSTEGFGTPAVDAPPATLAGPSTQGAGSGGGTPAAGVGTATPGTGAAASPQPTTDGGASATEAVLPGTGATPGAQVSPQATTGVGAVQGTATPSAGGGVLPNTGMPPQSQRAEVRGQRDQAVALSNVVGYQLVSANGQQIGTVSDYIINTCETFIVYMVVDPVSGVGSGGRFLVPFEAVTINSGAIDADARTIVVNMTPEQFSQAPAFDANASLVDGAWEGQVRSFYDPLVRVSNLSTECPVTGGPVRKVAFASQLLQAELRDGNGQPLGVVRQAILEPESGSIDFFVVELTAPGQSVAPGQQDAGQGQGAGQGQATAQAPGQGSQQGLGQGQGQGRLVLVPLAAVNIPEEAYTQGGPLWLVLLTDTGMLMSSPTLSFIEQAYSFDVQNAARQYWGQPMLEPGSPDTPNLPANPLNSNANANTNDNDNGNGGNENGNDNGNGNGNGNGQP